MNTTPFASVSVMDGPIFLVLFAAVILAVFIICRIMVRRLDQTGSLPPLPVSTEPDAYDVAYLRGGPDEVIRVLIFDLIQQGYLLAVEERFWIFSSKKKLVKNSEHPDLHRLSRVEQAVLECFSSPQSAQDIFRSSPILGIVAERYDEIDRRLCDEGFVNSTEVWEQARTIRWWGIGFVLAIGGGKLLAALSTGHTNVDFLILEGVFAALVLPAVTTPSRLTSRGRRYLLVLQEQYERLKEPAEIESAGDQPGVLVLGLALFGTAVLRGTSYDYFLDIFQQSAQGGCSMIGGCGGGGCGGGCGGCGGGGCGGGGCGGGGC